MDRMQHKVNFGAGLNLEFSFETGCLTKAKDPSLLYNLPRVGRRKGFLPFPKIWTQSEIVPSKIWIKSVNSISSNDKLC